MGILSGKKIEDTLSDVDELLGNTPVVSGSAIIAGVDTVSTPVAPVVTMEGTDDESREDTVGVQPTEHIQPDGNSDPASDNDGEQAAAVQAVEDEPVPDAATGVRDLAVHSAVGNPAVEFTVGDLSSVTDLSNFAMKVVMKQSRWYGVKRDRKAETDVQTANKAKVNAGKFTKELLAGCDKELKAVHSAIDSARTTHYSMTRPWCVVSGEGEGTMRRTGPRLLANADYFEYCQRMADHKRLIQEALDEFEPIYGDLKEQAKENLGSLYNEGDYPPVESIRSQFALDFDFEPLPDGSTFKEGTLEAAQAEKLADHLNKRTEKMLENALLEVWNKLYATVSHMADRLDDPNKTFHKSMLENAQEVAKMLRHYNFTNDPRMDEMRRELEGRLLTADVKELRKDKDVRKAVAEDAKRVLAKLQGYGLGSS